MRPNLRITIVLFLSLLCVSGLSAAPLGTAFTYQGRLNDGGTPANGLYDLRFDVYDSAQNGSSVGAGVTNPATTVGNGFFTVTLDFGPGVFTGEARWLEIGVRTNGSPVEFTLLTPRQSLTPGAYALHAQTAGSAAAVTGPVAAAQITGTLASSNIGLGTITAPQLASGVAFSNLYASGQSGVGARGIVLSEYPVNSNLLEAGYLQLGKPFDVNQERWTNFSGMPDTGKLSARRAWHAAVWAETNMYICAGYDEDGTLTTAPRYDARSDSWDYISKTNAPEGAGWVAVWTGSELLCTAGWVRRYDPVSNVWSFLSGSNWLSFRYGHAAVWTGSELLMWGGVSSYGSIYSDGLRYHPTNGTWIKMSTNGAPAPRRDFAYAWTGTELIIWGGLNASQLPLNNGARYNPSTDTWQPTSTGTNTPTARRGSKAVWTGTYMVVWGGAFPISGGRYHPSTDSWLSINTNGAPTARTNHTMIWTGSRVVVYGGRDSSGRYLDTGGIYNPSTDSWISMSLTNAPTGRTEHSAVWDPVHQQMIVWGGVTNDYYEKQFTDTGGRFSVSRNAWTELAIPPRSGDPGSRSDAVAVWTGTDCLLWGGQHNGAFLGSGGSYRPGTWGMIPLSMTGAPSRRIGHTAVWTGNEMLVWGGFGESGDTGTGARYHKGSNTWSPLSTFLAPSPRRYHTAVWTGSEMVVWGGLASNELGTTFFTDGARYNPISDTWRPLSNNLPSAARARHTAVWTGDRMLVWGGYSLEGMPAYTNYNPAGYSYRPPSSWAELPSLNAPSGRTGHSAVWTGREMIVWGGTNDSLLNSGARYDSVLNLWNPVTTNGAPEARWGHTGCWDGSKMIIWAGSDTQGARYDPATDEWSQMLTTGSASPYPGHCSLWTGGELLLWINWSAGEDRIYSYTPPRRLYMYLKP